MRLYLSVLLLAAVFTQAIAQNTSPEKKETPMHKKKVIVEDGKIYWNKSLPVYMFISTNPDGSDMIKLESKITPQYANPMYFDTEGVNYIRHKWAVDPETGKAIQPETEVQFEIYNDGLPPVTKASVSGENRYYNAGKTYYGKSVTVELTSEDANSGVEQVYQVVNGSQFSAYTSPLVLNEDKTYTVNYYAADRVGNVEEVKSKEFILDITPPTTQHAVTGTKLDDILSPKARIEIERNDATSGTKRTFYRFDENEERIYYGSLSLSGLQDGEHTITYSAEDNVGNKEKANSYTFYLDKTAPKIVSIVQGDRFNNRGRNYISGRSKLKLIANDNKAGVDKVYYQINGGEIKEYTSPFPINRSQGNMTVTFYATDKVGNKGTATTDRNLGNMYLDLTAPTVNYAVTGPKLLARDTMFVSDKSKIKLTAYDSESGIQKIDYDLDGKGNTEYNKPFEVTGANGVHTFSYSALDQVFNQMVKEDFVVLDTEGPEVYFHPSMQKIATQRYVKENKEIPVYDVSTQFYLAATDKLVGTDKIYYKIDRGKTRLYGTPVVISRKGNRKLTIWAIDALGNKSEEAVFDLVIQ